MKITCQACAAKYTIADEKVLGKIVKIRCKKCGATIIVNGNDPSPAGAKASDPPRAPYDYASQGAQKEEPWTVNVADGDQRSMRDSELVEAYQAGVVNDETFCWKDGMADWLSIREIEALYAACSATRTMAAPVRTTAPNPPDDGAATKIQQTAPLFRNSAPPAAAAHAAPRPGASPPANGAAMTSAAAPAATAAARRAAGRAPAADLFRGAAQAGSEEDVMTSAPVGMPEVHEDAAKLTGQRNETSVLFSLNALSSKPGAGPAARTMAASSEASGLIDIRQLSAQIGLGEDKKKSRIDDIMNLSGGGFTPSLSAPILTAPSIEEYAKQPDAAVAGQAPAGGRSKALIFGAVGAGVLVVAAAIGVATLMMGKPSTADADKAAGSATPGAAASGAVPATSAALTAPSTAASDTTAATVAPPADSSAAPGSSSAAVAPTAKTTSTAAATTTIAAATTKPATTATTVPAATAAAGASDQPFNMGEAKARLAGIAGSVQGCKKGDSSGSGRVVVTFAPSGGVASAVVSGAGFEGTPTGACVAARFRGAHVPAFAGSPFSVSKSFTIN